MPVISKNGLILLLCILPFPLQAQEMSSTQVNPLTNETTTTTVNPVTNQTIITESNSTTGETTTIIKSKAPSPQENIPIPQGYATCFMVSEGWHNDAWVPEHRVCQYDNSKGNFQGVAWIDGHWACTSFNASEGSCTKWQWITGHWVQSFDVY